MHYHMWKCDRETFLLIILSHHPTTRLILFIIYYLLGTVISRVIAIELKLEFKEQKKIMTCKLSQIGAKTIINL